MKNPVLFYFYGPKNRITVVTHVCPRKTEFGYVPLSQKLGLGIGPLDIIEMVLTCILFYRLKNRVSFYRFSVIGQGAHELKMFVHS